MSTLWKIFKEKLRKSRYLMIFLFTPLLTNIEGAKQMKSENINHVVYEFKCKPFLWISWVINTRPEEVARYYDNNLVRIKIHGDKYLEYATVGLTRKAVRRRTLKWCRKTAKKEQ